MFILYPNTWDPLRSQTPNHFYYYIYICLKYCSQWLKCTCMSMSMVLQEVEQMYIQWIQCMEKKKKKVLDLYQKLKIVILLCDCKWVGQWDSDTDSPVPYYVICSKRALLYIQKYVFGIYATYTVPNAQRTTKSNSFRERENRKLSRDYNIHSRTR